MNKLITSYLRNVVIVRIRIIISIIIFPKIHGKIPNTLKNAYL